MMTNVAQNVNVGGKATMVGGNPYQQYKQMSVQTASQGALILMLYDGALKFLRQAKLGISNGDMSAAHKSLLKAQDIVMELSLTLNMGAGEVAVNLRKLYDYMYRRLIQANIKKDETIVDEVMSLLGDLRSAWEQIIKPGKAQNQIGGHINNER